MLIIQTVLSLLNHLLKQDLLKEQKLQLRVGARRAETLLVSVMARLGGMEYCSRFVVLPHFRP